MGRNAIIRIVIVLAAALVLVLIIRRAGENRRELERASISHEAEDHGHALETSSARSPSTPGLPATLRFTHLSVADGLSQADVRAIVQDRQGFMWFGTWLGGLNRYDGYTFKVYKHDDQDDRSPGDNTIRTLYVDRAGVLWVGTNEGIDRYDRDTDSFVHYRSHAHDTGSLRHYRLNSFYEDEAGTFWLASLTGLGRFDRTSGTVFAHPDDPASVMPRDFLLLGRPPFSN